MLTVGDVSTMMSRLFLTGKKEDAGMKRNAMWVVAVMVVAAVFLHGPVASGEATVYNAEAADDTARGQKRASIKMTVRLSDGSCIMGVPNLVFVKLQIMV